MRSRGSRARSSTSSARWTGCRAASARVPARSSARSPSSRRSRARRPPTSRSPRMSGSRSRSSKSASPTSRARRSPRAPIPRLEEVGTVSGPGGDQIALIDPIEDTDAPDPQSTLSQTEMKEAIADAIARLPEREKLVVTLYYYEELPLREIGEVLGVTESRVSQLHTKAILRLKARLSGASARAALEH